MGKGARNRRKRKEEAVRRATEPLSPNEAITALLKVGGAAELRQTVERHPEVLDEEVETELREQAAYDGHGPFFAAVAQLAVDARTDPDAAWHRFAGVKARGEQVMAELDPDRTAISLAFDERRYDDVVGLCDAALPRAGEAGLGLVFGDLHEHRAHAHLSTASGNRAENLEHAIHSYSEALRLAIGREQGALRAMHLGLAYMERVHEDRSENIEQAIRLMRIALGELNAQCAPETWAVVRTNLALALFRRERGDRAANLEEAAELCRAALRYRSPERNGFDWAHSQLNLADILEQLARLGKGTMAEAGHAYQEVVDHTDDLREEWLLGAAHRSLARLRYRAGKRTDREIFEAVEADTEALDDRGLIEQARDHLNAARQLIPGARDPLQRGYVLNELAGVLAELEEIDESIKVGREALRVLRPTSAPQECVLAAGRLGHQLAERGQWSEAAGAFRDGVAAAELSFHARLETESREGDLEKAGNLARWASFAIAQVDEPLEAALVLETGRARELRRRLGPGLAETERLADLPQELATAYESAVAQLAVAPIGDRAASAARALQEALAVIRTVPGFEDFAVGARADDLFQALEPGWPLLYVNPTPYGTVLLRACLEHGKPVVTAHLLSRPFALEVFLRLMAGEAAALSNPAGTDAPSSYLMGIGGLDEDRDFQRDLDGVLPWLGEALAKPVRDCVTEVEAVGVTLVPCGPLGVAPLHACPWTEEATDKCLLDEMAVRYAPSAALMSASLQRPSASVTPSLLALGNPTGDLRAAGAEVEELQRQFEADRVQAAQGKDASTPFFAERAGQASHIHLACHARAGLLDASETGVLLADGFLSGPS